MAASQEGFLTRLFGLSGRVALITGAGSGLGRGYAETLAAAGCTVLLAGRTQKRLEEAAAEIHAHGGSAFPLPLDVTQHASIARAMQTIRAEHGRLDILINNAGCEHAAPFVEVTEDIFDRILSVNLRGAYFTAQAAAASMKETGGGKIINIGSLGSFIGLRESSVYCAAKGAILQLTRTMALELGKDGIQVNCLIPGYYVTPMTRPFYDDPQHRAWIESRIPLGRWGTSGDLAGAVLFLASSASDYVTGTALTVDGGWLAG